MTISKKRQIELRQDELTVRLLHKYACEQFGKAAVDADLTRLWDLRCAWGMKRRLPFGSTNFRTLGELVWIAKEVCGF